MSKRAIIHPEYKTDERRLSNFNGNSYFLSGSKA